MVFTPPQPPAEDSAYEALVRAETARLAALRCHTCHGRGHMGWRGGGSGGVKPCYTCDGSGLA